MVRAERGCDNSFLCTNEIHMVLLERLPLLLKGGSARLCQEQQGDQAEAPIDAMRLQVAHHLVPARHQALDLSQGHEPGLDGP